jgi:tetratricopeptide (TPR) repeat protein
MIYDLRDAPSEYLSSKEILGFSHSFEIKFGSEFKLLFGIGGKLNHYIANKRIGEQIRAGEIMSPISIESNIQHGNHLISVKEYQSATEIFNIIIKNSKDPDLLSIAWNNKAQCSGRLGRRRRELQQINKALKYRIRPEFLSNKIISLEALGRGTEADKVRKQLAELLNNP